MKNLLLLSIVLIFGFVSINAQDDRRGRPEPTPRPEGVNSTKDDINARSGDLRMTEKFPVRPNVKNSKTFREKIRPIYRKSDKKEREIIAPNSEDVSKFTQFLKEKNTGLTKLIADKGCDKEIGVVVSTPHCLEYSMPGGGSSYSFRYDDYRIKYLGDLQFTGNVFQSVGVLTHGIFVNIGDVPLEDVSLKTEGIDFLSNISPAENFAEAKDLIDKLEKGIEDGELVYKNNLPVEENTTYILRSIAYRGDSIRTLEGISYDELEFDKRKDVIVAFRIVRAEPNESVTILWKELASNKSPKIDK